MGGSGYLICNGVVGREEGARASRGREGEGRVGRVRCRRAFVWGEEKLKTSGELGGAAVESREAFVIFVVAVGEEESGRKRKEGRRGGGERGRRGEEGENRRQLVSFSSSWSVIEGEESILTDLEPLLLL